MWLGGEEGSQGERGKVVRGWVLEPDRSGLESSSSTDEQHDFGKVTS